jgi:predicted HicB family RNase H-like nuclease
MIAYAPIEGVPSTWGVTVKLKGKTQITIQVDDEAAEDARLVARRRGQSLSEFIRRAIDWELKREADCTVQ